MRRIATVLSTLALLATFAFAAVMLVPAVLGYERYVITSGSMTGTYDVGSLIFAKPVAPSALEVGDVITYTPPAGYGPTGTGASRLVTHRIHSIGRSADGRRLYQTKGDANDAVDPWKFGIPGPEQAKVVGGVPLVGFAYARLTDPDLRTIIFAVPAVIIALSVLLSLWRDAGEGARREALARAASEGGAPA